MYNEYGKNTNLLDSSIINFGGGEQSVVQPGSTFRLVSGYDGQFNIFVATASNPVGPFIVNDVITLPEINFSINYSCLGNSCQTSCYMWAYNAKEHLEPKSNGDIVINDNMNTTGSCSLLGASGGNLTITCQG